jgi:hypothetical protein
MTKDVIYPEEWKEIERERVHRKYGNNTTKLIEAEFEDKSPEERYEDETA